MEGKRTVEVVTLGSFALRCSDCIIDKSCSRAHKLWNLLEYLILHRDGDIPAERLADLLWPDGESDDPQNALKNLIYRLRTVLEKAGFPDVKNALVHHDGSYYWALPTTVDAEDMDRLFHEAENASLPAENRIERYLQGLRYYNGEFLPDSAYETWVIPLSTYYHSAFLNASASVATLLFQAQRYETAESVCQSAVKHDRYDERVNVLLMESMAAQKHYQEAMEYYEYISSIYYSELGVTPGEALKNCYRGLIRRVSHPVTDLSEIREELENSSEGKGGAFLCDYEIFRHMYLLEARESLRMGRAVFLGLVTLSAPEDAALSKKAYSDLMDRLRDTLLSGLRSSDVISRYSPSQYLLLLPTRNQEFGEKVLTRIKKQFFAQNRLSRVSLDCRLQAIRLPESMFGG